MSDVVFWMAEVSIKLGQLDNFKALVEEQVQWSQEDPKTLATTTTTSRPASLFAPTLLTGIWMGSCTSLSDMFVV